MITITSGALRLDLRPEIGGAIDRFRLGDMPLLRPTDEAAVATLDARACASYPLVPFSGRLRDNAFSFRGRTYALPPSLNGQAVHGVGWRRAWRVTVTTADRATLAYDHAPDGEWPFAFRAEQEFTLDAGGLSCRLAVTNLAPHEAPMGFGAHPFFPRLRGTRLRFSARCVWLQDEHKIPMTAAPIPPEWDFSREREVAGTVVDHCFSDWGGHASIALPHARIDMIADSRFRHLVFFVPEGRDYFAVEPVTNLTDGLNRTESEPMSNIFLLAPGERVAAGFRLAVTPA